MRSSLSFLSSGLIEDEDLMTTDCSSPGSERGPARIQGREDLQEDFREDPQEDPQERPRELPSSRPRSLDKSTKCVSDGEVDFVLIFMSILCSGIHTSVSSKYKYSYSIWYLISHYIVTCTAILQSNEQSQKRIVPTYNSIRLNYVHEIKMTRLF